MKRIVSWCIGVLLGAFFVWFGVGFFAAQRACASDPQFTCSPRDLAHPVEVTDASHAQAYYGVLSSGERDIYRLTIASATSLPLALLIPAGQAAGPARPLATVIDAKGETVANMTMQATQPFFDSGTRMDYVESRATIALDPGTYSIYVGVNAAITPQRYVLAIGTDTAFNPAELPYILGSIYRIHTMR